MTIGSICKHVKNITPRIHTLMSFQIQVDIPVKNITNTNKELAKSYNIKKIQITSIQI